MSTADQDFEDPTQRVEATTTPEGGEGWETGQARHVDPARGHGVDVAPDPQPEGVRAETRRQDDGARGEPGNAPTAGGETLYPRAETWSWNSRNQNRIEINLHLEKVTVVVDLRDLRFMAKSVQA